MKDKLIQHIGYYLETLFHIGSIMLRKTYKLIFIAAIIFIIYLSTPLINNAIENIETISNAVIVNVKDI